MADLQPAAQADAISLTKRMDELLAAKDLTALKAMYHPDIESVKPNGECIKGVEANFGTFERLIANQFPNIEIESFNFEMIEGEQENNGDDNGEKNDETVTSGTSSCTSSCSFDTITRCNNEAIVVDGVTKLAANAIYKVRKQNTFKDGLLIKVMMMSDQSAVVCKDGEV
uniref:SnoaL-like domain-containing protein n=1 Tax=Alexandrium monilatum TaxID=311494 RepID=A0A7S4S8X7_9DINO|eukprot:CAMPEP_0175241474 /NCGR_PEP_ID=MMETSP0093-20121207/30580_1 /TAXON_ID=311494 /ORGANISM="Alexandrium monilatum, Strain CCMP3105" /LENGTH=169 /DNA_ID=CAMNT_0016535537 /DNA_START=40 /DNA_END=549 /DNA_ORIENTATION=-